MLNSTVYDKLVHMDTYNKGTYCNMMRSVINLDRHNE